MNKRNLQKELEKIIEEARANNIRPKLLLHICCAPCSSYCMEYLNEYFDMSIYFYNPNIDIDKEYFYRLDEAKKLISSMNLLNSDNNKLNLIEGEYNKSDFHILVKGHEMDKEGGARCHLCYEMRLREAAKMAKERGFEYYTTSLTISPMKDSLVLCEIGERLANECSVKYLPSDFKKKNGYKRSVELSNEYDLYRQDYCGCSFSKRDRNLS